MNVRLPRGRALVASIALAVLVATAGIVLAVGNTTGTRCPASPVASPTHAGIFVNNRGWFGVDPALDADNRALQAFLDARVNGSCAEAWIGKGVKIGRGFYKGPEGTYYGWALYTFHDSPFCLLPGEHAGPGGRLSTYAIESRVPTDPSSDGIPHYGLRPGGGKKLTKLPSVYGGAAGRQGIGNKISASPGRYTYAITVGGAISTSRRYLIDVVGPGVNRYGKRLPAVILGEFEAVVFSSCPMNATPLVGV